MPVLWALRCRNGQRFIFAKRRFLVPVPPLRDRGAGIHAKGRCRQCVAEEEGVKIAVEITIFGHHFSEVVDYPGTPSSQAEVIQWLMTQTDYKWADYGGASRGDRMMYDFTEGVTN